MPTLTYKFLFDGRETTEPFRRCKVRRIDSFVLSNQHGEKDFHGSFTLQQERKASEAAKVKMNP